MIALGVYQAKSSFSVRTQNASFTIIKGTFVQVKQVDDVFKKVLIDYGEGMIDWYGIDLFKKQFEFSHYDGD